MKWIAALTIFLFGAVLSDCATTELSERVAPNAVQAANQRGTAEIGCPTTTATIVSKHSIAPPPTTGWGGAPSGAEFTIDVAGCGKRTSYLVNCNKVGTCTAGPVPVVSSRSRPELADELRPDAIRAAQLQGAKDISCDNATAAVSRQQTIEEGQTTGWYEPPHQAVYTLEVTGCGKSKLYLVACDTRPKGCKTGTVPAATAAPKQLADEWEPEAKKVANEKAATDLSCSAGTPEVTKKETLEEGQTTGWYEPPRQAVYSITINGCGQPATYFVICDRKKKRCVAGRPKTEPADH
ncbi:MAG: hypothetical protein JSR36_05235 [Proteobacteria bacterium]|nr:hypothetical protein [Pseudomonadota bacterium]